MRRWAWVELVVLSAATCVVHLLLLQAQRRLWSNGLDPAAEFSYPRQGADVAAGASQSLAVVLLGLGACALFAWLVLRAPRFAAAGLGPFAVAVPVLLAVGWWLAPPSLSIDAWSYLSHGYLAATPGSDPYLDPSASVAGTPYGAALLAEGWAPVHPQSPYGPLWTAIERAAYSLSGGDPRAGILLIKLPQLVAVLGAAAVIARFLRHATPERRLRGVLLLLANPLVLVELTGEGHNDGLMAALLVLGIVAAARSHALVAILALTLATLVKVNALPFAVPIAVALVVLRRSTRTLLLQAAIGLVASAVLALALIAPWWHGLATFDGLRTSGSPSFAWSVAGVLRTWLAPPDVSLYFPEQAAGGVALTQGILVALLVVGTVAASTLARTVDGLVRACCLVALLVLLLLPLEWPWYGTLPAAILPLAAGSLDVVAVLVLAVCSRLIAPIGDAASIGVVGTDLFDSLQAFVGQTVPAAIGLVLSVAAALRARGRRPAAPG